MKGRSVRTLKNRQAMLKGLAEGWSVTRACERAGISKTAYRSWYNEEADFAREAEAALESGTDRLEDEAIRRALDASDVLLIFLLKGRRPGIYNRKTLVVEGNPDAPLQGNATVMIYPKDTKS
jgi:hypothetical protein